MITTREFDHAMTLKADERLDYFCTLTDEDKEDYLKRSRAITAKNEANLLEFQTKSDIRVAALKAEYAELQRNLDLKLKENASAQAISDSRAEIMATQEREQSNEWKTFYKAIGIFVICPLALWFFFKASPEELAARAAKEAESKAFYDDYEAKRTAKAADEESAKINHSIRYKFILQTDLEASQGSKLSEQQNTELIRRAQEACGLYDPSIPSADGCK